MKAYQLPGILCVSVVALSGWQSTAAAAPREMPPNSYACHVNTSTAFPAVVQVQANDTTDAIALAKRSQAITFDGTPAQAAVVVQCILLPDEKFADATFQQNFDQMDR